MGGWLSIFLDQFPGAYPFVLSLALALMTLFVGYSIARIFIPKARLIEKLVCSYPLFFFLVYMLFLMNILASGTIFSDNKILIIISALILVASIGLNHWDLGIRRKIFSENKKFVLLLVAMLAVYSLPVMMSHGGIVWITGDMPKHVTWTSEIILGRTNPTSGYEGSPAFYPWMFHASLAYLQSFYSLFNFDQVRSVFLAYDTMSIITIIFGFISAAALSTVIFKNNRVLVLLSTFLTTFSGGFGFFLYSGQHGISAVMGDLLVNQPFNFSLVLVAPVWPRQLSYVFFVALLYLLLKLMDSDDGYKKFRVVLLGVSVGMVALIETIPVLIVLTVMGLLFLFDLVKRRINYPILFSTLISVVIISPFAVSFLLNALKYGTESVTTMATFDLTPLEIFFALGQASIFFVFGAYLVVRTKVDYFDREKMKVLNILILLFVALIIASDIDSALGLQITMFFVPILRQEKYWSMFYVLLAIYSSIGAYHVMKFLEPRGKKLYFDVDSKVRSNLLNWKIRLDLNSSLYKTLFILIVILLGIGSPVVTSYKTAIWVADTNVNAEFSSPRPNELMFTLLTNLTKTDVVATPLDDKLLTRNLICFTGAYVVYNFENRTRFTGLYEEIPSPEERISDTQKLYSETYKLKNKIPIIKKYHITYIVTNNSSTLSLDPIIERTIKTIYMQQEYYLHVVNRTAVYGIGQ